MTTDCKHARIQTWRFEDSAEVAGLWSCADCGLRFEPIAPVVPRRPAITASMVGELRAKTDAPMMECKKALTEADGDMVRAEEILRVKPGNKAPLAQRQPLSDEQINAIWRGTLGYAHAPRKSAFDMARAIEAAHGIVDKE